MPDIASALKAEIARIARKEIRGETDASKKAMALYRRQIAELKRRADALERELAKLHKQPRRSAAAKETEAAGNLRFRATGFAKHRERLGLSAREVGLLLDASPLSVYKWESGQARPRSQHLEAIAALRKMGKREARKRLDELTAQ